MRSDPAAGRGSRLGVDLPKLLVPVSERDTIWSVLKGKLKPFVDHIHVVLSTSGLPVFMEALAGDPDASMVSTSVQTDPIGMGDAIFRGYDDCRARAQSSSFGATKSMCRRKPSRRASTSTRAPLAGSSFLLVTLAEPYVEYRFGEDGRLSGILQSREGDICKPGGWGDVGTFLLSTDGLLDTWQAFLSQVQLGARTGEVNFLPLPGFPAEAGWDVKSSLVSDPREARGINSPEDLAFFREVYLRTPGSEAH